MIDTNKVLLFLKDFTESGSDRFFIFDGSALIEKSASDISEIHETIVCHDYWLIAKSIFKKSGNLPTNVIDLFEFSRAISGDKNRNLKESDDLVTLLTHQPNLEKEDISNNEADIRMVVNYLDVFYKKIDWEFKVYESTARLIQKKWQELKSIAIQLNEMNRQIDIEIPLFNLLYKHITPGININQVELGKHKKDIEHDYYTCLKKFSKKHNFPLEVPSDQAVVEYLEKKGFDFSEASVDYVLKFVLTPNGFGDDVIELRKIYGSRNLLSALPIGKSRSTPIINTFGSITSRIYFKNPVFQNISKKHRNVIQANSGKKLSYVDYDQFEVGVMAALSKDPNLTSLYNEDDLYESLSEKLFGNRQERKFSKKIFLYYAYGMKIDHIVEAAVSHGATRATVKQFFRQFSMFETWKKQVHAEFQTTGAVSSIYGNFLRREKNSKLTEKEKRSCVSQLIQGTASYIFKKALLSLEKAGGFRIILPMHDAVLVEHDPIRDPNDLVLVFCEAMTSSLGGAVKGKASIEPFFVN